MKKLIILFFAFMTCAGFVACTGHDPVNPPVNPGKDTVPVPVVVDPANELVLYQANEKIFARTNAFKAVDARLDEIQALHVNVLWLMPIHPIGGEGENGNANWTVHSPYCVKDFKGINTAFGTLDDLKTLVEHAHAKNMRVILDWVANHSALDHPWVTEHPDWYGTPSGDEKNWNDVKPFNFNNKDMRAAMIDAMTYWVKTADIDGFRCDFAQGCPDDFWREAITAIRGVKADAIMLAETSRLELYTAGFDWMYSWSYLGAIQGLMSKGSLAGLYSTSDGEFKSTPAGKQRIRYVTNHDACSERSNSELYKTPQGMLAASCLTYFLGGIPLIYSSQEIGYMNKINFCVPSSSSVLMDWNSNPDVLQKTKQLMAAYNDTKYLRSGELEHAGDADVAMLTYDGAAGKLLVLVNIRNVAHEINTPSAFINQQVRDHLTGEQMRMPRQFELGAYEYKIYSLIK